MALFLTTADSLCTQGAKLPVLNREASKKQFPISFPISNIKEPQHLQKGEEFMKCEQDRRPKTRFSTAVALLLTIPLLGIESSGQAASLVSQPYKLVVDFQGTNIRINWVGQ